MATPTPAAGPGRINGLHRGTSHTRGRLPFGSRFSAHVLAVGSGLYATSLTFPLVLKEVTSLVFLAALTGTGLVLLGLHLRWSARPTK